MNNPYSTPNTQELLVSDRMQAGSVWKAVIAGFVVDWVVTIAVSFVIGAIGAAYLMSSGVPKDQVTMILQSKAITSFYYMGSLVAGLAVSFLAARVCCKIAGTNAKKSIIILAALMVVSGGIFDVLSHTWGVRNIVLELVTLAVYYAGYRSFLKRHLEKQR